ncbi:MAG TPA: hypothetical protein VFZ61_14405 [Polyangiales bacterium]
MRALGLLAVLLGVGACSLLHERSVVKLSEERLARARELGAETRAPLAYQRFQAARQNAESTRGDPAARSDYASEARLWLEAAVAQAERARFSEQRLVLEQECARLDAELLTLERAREERDDQRELAAAAAVAQLEAERALARAADAPAQRVRLSAAETREAARALLQRAELVELALPAEADAGGRNELAAALKEARAQLAKAPDRALLAADRALFRALALLAPLRASDPQPSSQSKASLLEALTLLGTKPVRTELGLSATFAGPDAHAPRTLERLCSVVGAYPAGSVQLALPARAAAAAKETPLPTGCDPTRVKSRVEPALKALSVVFTAY